MAAEQSLSSGHNIEEELAYGLHHIAQHNAGLSGSELLESSSGFLDHSDDLFGPELVSAPS